MNASFEALPEWLHTPFIPVRDAASLLLDRGEDEKARSLVEVIRCPAEWSGSQAETFETVKSSLLAGIDALIAETQGNDPLRSPEVLAAIEAAAERRHA